MLAAGSAAPAYLQESQEEGQESCSQQEPCADIGYLAPECKEETLIDLAAFGILDVC